MAATKGSAEGSTFSAASNRHTGASISAFGKATFRNMQIAAQNHAFEHGVHLPEHTSCK